MENRFIADELNYDKDKLCELHESLIGKLTEEHHSVYFTIMKSVLT